MKLIKLFLLTSTSTLEYFEAGQLEASMRSQELPSAVGWLNNSLDLEKVLGKELIFQGELSLWLWM